MIILKISGGLGNQLFQYSFGRNLSLSLKTKLKLDIQTELDHGSFTKRNSGLKFFNIEVDVATYREIARFKSPKINKFSRIERIIAQKFPWINRKYIVQDFSDKFRGMKEFCDNVYYDGYWQSENFFKSNDAIIRKDLEFNLELNHENSKLNEEIINCDSVSIHIRRGDYLSIKANRKIFYSCPPEYYLKGIEILNAKSENKKYYIFSDEIEWAKRNFHGDNFRFMESNINEPEVDLYLMSKCKNNIISNSSFSWWGAWLNSNPDKSVIAPKNWYIGKLNRMSDEILPNEWIRI
jgi:hypothetical protein